MIDESLLRREAVFKDMEIMLAKIVELRGLPSYLNNRDYTTITQITAPEPEIFQERYAFYYLTNFLFRVDIKRKTMDSSVFDVDVCTNDIF